MDKLEEEPWRSYALALWCDYVPSDEQVMMHGKLLVEQLCIFARKSNED